MRVPESARGRVVFESLSGKLNSALPLTVNTSWRRQLSGQLGSAGGPDQGHITVKTFSGSVSLDR